MEQWIQLGIFTFACVCRFFLHLLSPLLLHFILSYLSFCLFCHLLLLCDIIWFFFSSTITAYGSMMGRIILMTCFCYYRHLCGLLVLLLLLSSSSSLPLSSTASLWSLSSLFCHSHRWFQIYIYFGLNFFFSPPQKIKRTTFFRDKISWCSYSLTEQRYSLSTPQRKNEPCIHSILCVRKR